MKFLKNNYRVWWQIPRRAGVKEDDRQVSFLELFYDLVYVVIIAQLAHALATHMSLGGVINFVFLFIVVWWAWFNGTLYHETHGNNDFRTRIFTFLQMIAVIAMAVFAHDAIGKSSIGFALSYAAFQLILTFLWWRTGVHDTDHKPLSDPYAAAFLFNTVLWIASVFIPEPFRYHVWGLATVLSLVLPLIVLTQGKRNKDIQEQIDLTTQTTKSLVERFGLFTIIVLGEVIVAVVSGISGEDFILASALIVLLGSLIAIGLWWVYFDFVSHRKPKKGFSNLVMWFYTHLPLTMGIAGVGAALLYVINHLEIQTHVVLSAAIALTLLCISLLIKIIQHTARQEQFMIMGGRAMVSSAILILVLGFLPLKTLLYLILVAVLLLAPVLTTFLKWAKSIDKK